LEYRLSGSQLNSPASGNNTIWSKNFIFFSAEFFDEKKNEKNEEIFSQPHPL
jgi:hypothetical protein